MMIIPRLRELQEKNGGWLPEAELRALSEETNTPLHRLHEVASFYPYFRMSPPPKADVLVCRDISCHLRGAPELLKNLTSAAKEFGGDIRVGGVSCLGQCDRAPAVSINHHIYRGLTERHFAKGMRAAARGKEMPTQYAETGPLGWKIDVYNGKSEYNALKRYLGKLDQSAALKPEDVLSMLEAAKLRGMGGAGFPTHIKWSGVRAHQTEMKYVVCNADESEPGTFKDREILRRAPYLIIEGMVLAALVTGATRGFIYVRHEFEEEIHVMEKAVKKAMGDGICGADVLGSGHRFELEVYVSPGGYVQGEESALLEAIEDRRGEPRNKPPLPAAFGLFGQPTVINNVETLSWVPGIVLNGPEWYANFGVNGATGMRFVSISGDVKRPGVYEVPLGQTVRELIKNTAGGMLEGHRLKAIATSGPSGGFLPALVKPDLLPQGFIERIVEQGRMEAGAKWFEILNLPLDFNTLNSMNFPGQLMHMLGAAFVAVGDRANLVDLALNCTQFYRNESCGKCVPCRMGSQKMTDLIATLLKGKFRQSELLLIDELSETMTQTSICGLGMVAGNPIATVRKYFPEEIKRYLEPSS